MPIDKWPCIPESFFSVLQEDLPIFLQSGVAHFLHRIVSIIDLSSEGRIDPFIPYEYYSPFCKFIRYEWKKEEGTCNTWNNLCKNCDLLVAEKLCTSDYLSDSFDDLRFIHYRCYMGFEEVATAVSFHGLPLLIISGQFMPQEGMQDIGKIIMQLGSRLPLDSVITPETNKWFRYFEFPDSQWNSLTISPEDKNIFITLAKQAHPIPEDFENNLRMQIGRILSIAESYYQLKKGDVESKIMHSITSKASKISPIDGDEHLDIQNSEMVGLLEELRKALNLEYIVFYTGHDDRQTVLNFRFEVRDKKSINASALIYPHFNWKKAGLRTDAGINFSHQIYEWENMKLNDRSFLKEGFRPSWHIFNTCSGILPIHLPNGPYGAIVLGPQLDGVDLEKNEKFVLNAARYVGTTILTFQLAHMLAQERSDWKKTTNLLGHRTRASLQNINSQTNIVLAVLDNKPGFNKTNLETAKMNLRKAVNELVDLSRLAESDEAALDVKSARRDLLPITDIIASAIAAQQDEAENHGILIEVDWERLSHSPKVWINRALMRLAFIHLINNGLKYSYPRLENRKRILNINPPRNYDLIHESNVAIEIVNFGLGIKQEDYKRIFEWGIRLPGGKPVFEGVYGKGIGLWEVKKIIEGHGGNIIVRSSHYTGDPVTDMNIEQCITVFTVILPSGAY